jgi:hypothetical protein
MNKYTPKLTKNKFIDYLRPHMPVGAGGIDAKERELNDAGLMLALCGSRLFFDCVHNLLTLSESVLPEIEERNTSEDITKIGKIFTTNQSDKAGPKHRYDLVYQSIFSELQTKQSINILEIGLGTNNPDTVSHMGRNGRPGASLYAYREFFPKANIFGADVDKRILFESERIKTAYVDQLKTETFDQMHRALGEPELDLFIEDGLHSVSASLNSLNYAISVTKKNGYIILEDLYNPQRIWQSVCLLLDSFFDFQSIKLVNSGGLMLVVQV